MVTISGDTLVEIESAMIDIMGDLTLINCG